MPKPNGKKGPAHEVRLGLIKAVIWENETRNGSMYNVVLTRIYRDGEEWKETSSLGRDDLLLASKLLDSAFAWIMEKQAA